jgi:hypothetical protein
MSLEVSVLVRGGNVLGKGRIRSPELQRGSLECELPIIDRIW